MSREFQRFQFALPKICKDRKLSPSELTYQDFLNIAADWITKSSA